VSKPTIAVCDDEELIRWSLSSHLVRQGYQVETAEDGEQCLELVRRVNPAALLLDLKLPRLHGMEVLRRLREEGFDLPVIVVTAHGELESAIEATRLGATAYMQKPFNLKEVTHKVHEALAQDRLRREVRYLRERERTGYGEFIGSSPALGPAFAMLERLERVHAPSVLIFGEAGVGKDLIARQLHRRGNRRNGPFLEFDCTSGTPDDLDNRIFGSEQPGAGAVPGLPEVAAGGILYLDEIAALPLSVQGRLLRALETRSYKRVGGVQSMSFDVQLIAATSRDLRQEVTAGRFRADLLQRLSIASIQLPSLRERASDIPDLVNAFLTHFNREFGRDISGVNGEAMAMLEAWTWPGNVRELRNVIERIVLLGPDEIISPNDMPPEIRFFKAEIAAPDPCPFVLPEEGIQLEAVERGLIVQALDRTKGNQSAASRLLGISRYALRYRMEKYDLDPKSGK